MAHSIVSVRDDLQQHPELCHSTPIPGIERVLSSECLAGELVHSERTYSPAEDVITEVAVRPELVVGSGQRGKAYLHRRGQALLMTPLNWYRLNERWDLAPGYHPDDVRRFDRRVREDCVGCHSGHPAVSTLRANVFAEPAFHEMRIGCERCHGPGAGHIAWRRQNGSLNRSVDDPIVNPASLDTERQEAVCYQCHLSAAARVLHAGKRHSDFVPGMLLSEVWGVLDVEVPVSPDQRTKSVRHVQQMRASRCFVDSEGKLGCISCHNPHRAVDVAEQANFYRARCQSCHTPDACDLPAATRLERSNDCIACHMPRLDSSNMEHVVQTDHRILRKPVADDAGSEEGSGELQFFAGMDSELTPPARDRSRALGTFVYFDRKGRSLPPNLRSDLERSLQDFPDDGLLLEVLGTIARQEGDVLAAYRYLGRARETREGGEAALHKLLEMTYAVADWPNVLAYADELLAIDPGNVGVLAMRGDARLSLGETDDGIADVRRAVALHPTAIPLREWLVRQYERLGRTEDLQAERRIIEQLRQATIPAEFREAAAAADQTP
ncbi:MAG: hypothetical protein KDA75_05835 [Planctomycetaceae bacterium]|nr:hypothetical protein [Planctomycetaceae bacterium]